MPEYIENLPDNTHVIPEEQPDNLFSGLQSECLHELPPAKTRMILLYITGQYNLTQLGEIIGVRASTVSAWLRQAEVQQIIKELQAREFDIIDGSLKALRMKAVESLSELLSSPIDAVRLQATKDVLDRTGHKSKTEMKIDKTVTTIEQQLKDLADVTIDDSEVIDITDVVEQIKGNCNDN